MTYRGVYDSATQYEQLDVVRYQSAAYLALTDVIGEAPGTTAKWGLIAQDGVYSAVAGTGISLNGNTISLDSTVVNNLIATYLASVKSQTITAQSTHNQIPTALAVYNYAASKVAVNNLNTEIQHIEDSLGDKLDESDVEGILANKDFEEKSNRVGIINAQSDDDHYPTAKAVYDYAASKASYTYLNNQYTQLANDVAQLPTTAEVQQMIDDSTGAAINSISLDKSSQSITLSTGSIINEQSLITGLSIPYGTKIYVKLGFSANDNPIISGKAVQIRANGKFIVSLNRGAVNTWTEVTLSGQLTSGEIITRLGVYLANDVLSTQTDFILSVRSPIIKSINDKESTANKVTSINANSTDAQYPSAAAVYALVQNAIQNAIGGE